MIGTAISHYRITEKLGQGGMGEVFLAHDTILDRKVALKFLPDIFSDDPERLARFEREAKLLASLNHPNIAAIYGLEQADGKRFLALELVEGKTLAQQIEHGPMPVDEALEVCRQIAEGVEAAHEKGIIHRDLKPANVKVTPEGKVKVLDFGLGRAIHDQPAAADLSHSPTITQAMTHSGIVLGTAAYMSPEQAKGKAVDKRTDIWAFGCILYECLTGRKVFEGEGATETMAAILRGEPDWTVLPPWTPIRLIGLLRKCLRKDPRERLRDIGDARIEMVEAVQVPVGEDRAKVTIAATNWKLTSALVLCAAIFGALLTWVFVQNHTKSTASYPAAAVQVSIGTDAASQLGAGSDEGLRPSRTALAFSPDGKWLVYWGRGSQGVQLFRRGMADRQAEAIAGSEGGRDPFFSPDSRYIGFWANGKLKKVVLGGGSAVTLCDVAQPTGITWASTNEIYFSMPSIAGKGIFKVSADGGTPVHLTWPNPYEGEIGHILPCALPGGENLLFTVRTSVSPWDNPRIEVLSLKTGERKIVIPEGSDGRYAPSGHIVFAKRGTLFAAPFDIARLEAGTPVPLIEGVMHAMNEQLVDSNTFAAQFTISASGSLAYVEGGTGPDPGRWMVWVDPRKGSIEPVIPDPKAYFAPRLSPDGRQIVYATRSKERQIWVFDIERHTRRAVETRGSNSLPIWSYDGKRVAWVSQRRDGKSDVLWSVVDDPSAEPEILIKNAAAACSWSPNGDSLAFVRNSRIWILHMKDRSEEQFLVTSQYRVTHPEFSPDGRYLAYTSDQTGRNEIFVRAYPGPGKEVPVSTDGGSCPAWGQDGKNLFYVRGEDRAELMAVDVTLNPDFNFGKVRSVCDYWGIGFRETPGRCYDIDYRGQRFLVIGQVFGGTPLRYADLPEAIQRDLSAGGDQCRAWLRQTLKSDAGRRLTPQLESWLEPKPITQINLIINWFEELTQRAPGRER